MGPTPPLARPGASYGVWRPSCARSRTPPKPPFQNPSIAGWDYRSPVWDKRDSGMLLCDALALEAGPRVLQQRSGRPHTRRTGTDSPAQLASPRSRGKSRDTGMLKRDHRPFCDAATGVPRSGCLAPGAPLWLPRSARWSDLKGPGMARRVRFSPMTPLSPPQPTVLVQPPTPTLRQGWPVIHRGTVVVTATVSARPSRTRASSSSTHSPHVPAANPGTPACSNGTSGPFCGTATGLPRFSPTAATHAHQHRPHPLQPNQPRALFYR